MNVIHEKVLIQLPEITNMSATGVALPVESLKSREGVIVRFGEAIPEELKTLFGSKPKIKYKEYYDGEELEIEGKQFIVMNYKDILLIY